MVSNGRLPAGALAPIPGGRLERHTALYWNALVAEAKRSFGVELRPEGPLGSYRPYAAQLLLWHLYQQGKGNLAAYPGTSNHGLGVAIDLGSQQMRAILDRIGARFGFSKACSDAQSEWWHIKFNPSCTGATWRPPQAQPLPVLRKGARGPIVVKLQKVLRHKGFKVRVTGKYDLPTRMAIRTIQRRNRIRPVSGECGPRTWKLVLR